MQALQRIPINLKLRCFIAYRKYLEHKHVILFYLFQMIRKYENDGSIVRGQSRELDPFDCTHFSQVEV